MNWISIDPATKTGIARWHDHELMYVATMRPASPKERKAHGHEAVAVVSQGITRVMSDRLAFWTTELATASAVIVEEAMGFSPKAVAQLGFRRGYIAACAERFSLAHTEVNTSSWRKVAGEAWNVSFPAKSDAAKALSVSLVREHYGIECSDDEADAVLIGHWALRTRTVRP